MFLMMGVCVVVAGGCLWRVGKRGRRVDEHPLCGKCRYDLTGLPATSRLCPECGLDVKAAGAILRGNRERLGGLGWSGLLVMLTGLLISAGGARRWWEAFDSMPWRPEFQLRRDVVAASPPSPAWHPALVRTTPFSFRERAINELHRRIEAGIVSREGIRAVADDLLVIQGDPSRYWDFTWGDLIVHAALKGLLTDAQRERFIRQLGVPELRVEPVVQEGDRLKVWSALEDYRGWRQGGLLMTSATGILTMDTDSGRLWLWVVFGIAGDYPILGGREKPPSGEPNVYINERFMELPRLGVGKHVVVVKGEVTMTGDWKELGEYKIPFQGRYEVEVVPRETAREPMKR